MSGRPAEGFTLTRREMLRVSAMGALSLAPSSRSVAADAACDYPIHDGIPAVDFHAHVGDGVSIDDAIAIARRLGLKFGLLQHAGAKGHDYQVSDDAELRAWTQALDGKPVYKGIEGEGADWVSAFSKAALATLDYVQADPFAVPDDAGVPLQIWRREFRPGNPQAFMDRYVDYHLRLITTFPIDILAVPTVLPEALRGDYDRLWTARRTQRIVD